MKMMNFKKEIILGQLQLNYHNTRPLLSDVGIYYISSAKQFCIGYWLLETTHRYNTWKEVKKQFPNSNLEKFNEDIKEWLVMEAI